MAKIRHELLDPPGPQIHTPPPLPDMTPPRHHVPHLPAQPIIEPEGQVEVDIRHPDHSGSYSLEGTTTEGNAIHLIFTDSDMEENGGKLIIGRKLEMVNLHIDDHSLSRQHATIVRHGHSLYLEDHESSNGTFVNGEKVGGEVEAIKLKSGSSVRLGSVTLTFRLRN